MNDENQSSPPQRIIYAYPPDYYQSGKDDEIDLRELWSIIWRGRWIVAIVSIVFAISAVVYSLSLPDIYRSSAVLAPSEEAKGGGLSKMAGQLGGLASLAGISLGGGEGADKVAIALKVVTSRKFVTDFVERHDIMAELMAVEGWNRNDGQLVYDPDLYNEARDVWVREVDSYKTPKPSAWEAYEAFMKILTVSQEKETGFVTVEIEHPSPHVAQQWVKLVVEELNAVMKEKDVTEARRSIEYLNKQLDQVPLAEMRAVFYQLIEDQIQTMMLADVRDEYVFTTIDPPVVPEEKAEPQRAAICVLAFLLGLIVSTLFVLLRHMVHR